MAPIKRSNVAVEPSERPVKKQKAFAGKPSLLLKDDTPFPRGGASVLTPLEHKQIKIQASQDVLFEQTTGQKAPRNILEDEDGADLPHERSQGPIAPTPKQSKTVLKKKKSIGRDTQEQALRIESLSYKVWSIPRPMQIH